MSRDARVIIDCSRDDVVALKDDKSSREETEEKERDNTESTVTEERTEPTVRQSRDLVPLPKDRKVIINSKWDF